MFASVVRRVMCMNRFFRNGVFLAVVLVMAQVGCAAHGGMQTRSGQQCRVPSDGSVQKIDLPGRAWHAIASRDGCWIFASMHPAPDSPGSGGLAIITRTSGEPVLVRTVPHPLPATGGRTPRFFGLALTRDGRVLIVAGDQRLSFYDVDRLISGSPEPLLGVLEDRDAEYFHMVLSPDERLLLVTNHAGQDIRVVDFAESRRQGFANVSVIGAIPVGVGPNSIVSSANGRRYFAISQVADSAWAWPNTCRPFRAPATATADRPGGAVHVIDAARIVVDPAHSVIATVAAGCDPVRLAYAPRGGRLYVTARSDDALLVFDAERLVTDSAHARVATVVTPAGPVGLALVDGGRWVAVANAVRFSPPSAANVNEEVTTVDADAVTRGRSAITRSVFSGGGPVDVTGTPGGDVLIVANFDRKSLTLIPVRLLIPR
jgi:DNA-binding beta-propeller fold protein YncE